MDVAVASYEELIRVPGVGPVVAQRLVRERSKVDVTVTVGRRKPQPLKP